MGSFKQGNESYSVLAQENFFFVFPAAVPSPGSHLLSEQRTAANCSSSGNCLNYFLIIYNESSELLS